MRAIFRGKRAVFLAAIPIACLGAAAILIGQIRSEPPLEPSSPNLLGMPGDQPADEVQRPQTTGLALEMRGTLVAADPESVLIRRPDELDAQIFLSPQTAITLEGAPATFDELRPGGGVLVIYDLDGQRRIATSVDASLPGAPPPERNAAAPTVPTPPGADVEGGLLPDAAPEMPPAEEPPAAD